jgi:hypothetical protein
MQIRSVGIDLGKTTFHLVALGDNGNVLLKKKFTQRQAALNTSGVAGLLALTTRAGLVCCHDADGPRLTPQQIRDQLHDALKRTHSAPLKLVLSGYRFLQLKPTVRRYAATVQFVCSDGLPLVRCLSARKTMQQILGETDSVAINRMIV